MDKRSTHSHLSMRSALSRDSSVDCFDDFLEDDTFLILTDSFPNETGDGTQEDDTEDDANFEERLGALELAVPNNINAENSTDPDKTPEPEIVLAARRGDLALVRRLVEQVECPTKDGIPKEVEQLKRKLALINESRRWTTTTKSAPGVWHNDVTALTAATQESHADVVEYLLRQGANPTLKCSDVLVNDTNGSYDTFTASTQRVLWYTRCVKALLLKTYAKSPQEKQQTLKRGKGGCTSYDNSLKLLIGDVTRDPRLICEDIFKSSAAADRCERLLTAASPFWKKSAAEDEATSDMTTTAFPSDMDGLLSALDAAPQPESVAEDDMKNFEDRVKDYCATKQRVDEERHGRLKLDRKQMSARRLIEPQHQRRSNRKLAF